MPHSHHAPRSSTLIDWYRALEDHDRQAMTCLVDSEYMAALEFEAWCIEHPTLMFTAQMGKA